MTLIRTRTIPVCLVILLRAAWSVASDPSPTATPEGREVRGVVLDTDGRPVANADVASYWSANGTQRDKKGDVLGVEERAGATSASWPRILDTAYRRTTLASS